MCAVIGLVAVAVVGEALRRGADEAGQSVGAGGVVVGRRAG